MHGWATSLRFVMAAWVWLCGFPARAFRLREVLEQQAEDAESCQQQAKRMRFGTSIARTLAEREVAPPDCSNMEDWFDTRNLAAKLTAYSLLRVEPGHTWDWPLTPWSDEAALQRVFFRSSTGCIHGESHTCV